jgi:hypothetical protein
MTYRGRIEKGVVVLEPGANLPEGAEIAVVLAENRASSQEGEATIGQKLAALGRSLEGKPCDLPTGSGGAARPLSPWLAKKTMKATIACSSKMRTGPPTS